MRKDTTPIREFTPEDLEALTEDDKTLLESYRQKIYLEIENYSRIARIDDWKKCKPIEWHGFCNHIGNTVFTDRKALREKVADHGSAQITNNNAYNLPLLSAIYDIYADLCYSLSGLPCRAFDYQAFIHIPHNSFSEMRKRVTAAGLDFLEKVAHDQENTVAMGGEGGRINPTMSLAWLNHHHGWTQSREIIHRDGGQIMDSGSWSGRFLGDSQKACSIPEGKESQGEAVLLPETT